MNLILEKTNKLLKNYAFIFKEVHRISNWLLIILIASTLTAGCAPLVTQYILKIMISLLEKSLTSGINIPLGTFIALAIVYELIIVIKNVMKCVQNSISRNVGFNFTQKVHALLINKLKKVTYKSFYFPCFQNEYKIILENSHQVPMNVVFTSFLMMSYSIQAIGSLLIILNLNVFVLIVLIVCLLIGNLFINVKIEKGCVKIWENCAMLYRKDSYFFDILTNKNFIKELRLFNLSNYFFENKIKNFDKLLNHWKEFTKKEIVLQVLAVILPHIGILASVVWLLTEVMNGQRSIANFVFYTDIIFTLESACNALVAEASHHYKSILFINKLFDFLNIKNEIVSGNIKIAKKGSYILEFKNVSFQYPNSEKYALKNINLKIETGDKISLVGENGCGKTTLVSLILRIYNPTEGKILLNGINIQDYNYKEYMSFFSAVFQDYQRYCVPLTDYVSFGNIKNLADLSKIKHALLNATASDFVEKSEKKLGSNLTKSFDSHGLELSEGQWQRLAISRTFFSNAKMLIFDEPTSALDAVSESKIYENIQKISKDKMVIFISHRMYTSRSANKIIFMQNGEISATGSHLELIQKSEGYKILFEEQATKYI